MSQALRFPVDATTILNLAASLGETNRIYYDEDYAKGTALGGVIAPPTFSGCASHWNPKHPFRGIRRIPAPPMEPAATDTPGGSGSRADRGGGGGPGGADLMRVLHGEQRFEYHKPIRPGMVLSVSGRPGRTWEKEGRRGGRMQFAETVTEFRDPGGELVVTATSVGIVTARAVE